MHDFTSSLLELIIGIAFLFWGGELFVQGSIILAGILGIPQLVIGLTVVSLGTSAPELFVSLNSFYQGSDALAASNVVGSNIFNILVVLGSSAIILPLKVESRLIRRDVPLLIAVSSAVWGMTSNGRLTWQAGIALLIALLINTAWEIRTVREESKEKDCNAGVIPQPISNNWINSLTKLFIGIVLLSFGSKLLVNGASSIALLLGVSEAVIGLTIVAAGTSMPELITSLIATFKGRTDLAIGNVVGSSILNLLLVLSLCAISSGTTGLEIDEVLINKDMPIMLLSTLACMPIFWTKGKISRLEGIGLLSLYILYLIDQIIPYSFPILHEEFRIILVSIILPTGLILVAIKSIKYFYIINQEKYTSKLN
ncbi:calcium/sodium antiporter [Prochlorococcus sp. MIT 1223]|uniref:calcium/sodium antiporter n=1 Tax=Prochlorococcus sp. MIT 1223 TaxID=3096217 RepID=UPI002A75642F|nr:calcium/sodium antiporter [Prochlorococcus sp. MIT 1223]